MSFQIPQPPKDMFTAAEWAAILAKRAERERTNTKAVGE